MKKNLPGSVGTAVPLSDVLNPQQVEVILTNQLQPDAGIYCRQVGRSYRYQVLVLRIRIQSNPHNFAGSGSGPTMQRFFLIRKNRPVEFLIFILTSEDRKIYHEGFLSTEIQYVERTIWALICFILYGRIPSNPESRKREKF